MRVEIALKYDGGMWSWWREVERDGLPVVVVAESVVHRRSCERGCLCVRRTRTWYRQVFAIAPALVEPRVGGSIRPSYKNASYYFDGDSGDAPPTDADAAWCQEAIVEAALPRYVALLVDIGRGEEAAFEVLGDLVDERFDFRPAFQPMMSAVLGLLADGVHALGLPLRAGG